MEYGINRRAALEDLSYFHVVHALPQDIMHDLMEGVIPHEMKLLLQSCVADSSFDMTQFNHRLSAFDFGYSEIGDKPAPIDDGVRIRQSATQMWLLFRIFPLLIGDLIPRSFSSSRYLEMLIEEHHSEFSELYGNSLIIPKMHFMVHCPSQILRFGPLVYAWTMRYEAKLRIMKRAAKASNFKNVCQTVAKRHQHLLCYYLHVNKIFLQNVEIGPCKLTISFAEESLK